VGFFVHTLVLRQSIDPTATFRTLLNQTRSTLLDAVSNQDCPFETVVDAVNAPRDTSRNPLFDVLAVWQDNNSDLSHFLGTSAKPVEFPFPFSKFDLEFYFQAFAEGVHAYAVFDTDLFEATTIEALLRRFEVITAAALQNPDAPISDLPWMSEDEAAQVVHGFNSTAVEVPDRQTIPQPFLAQVARNGNATAVITSNQSLTYTAFARRAAHVAEQLARCGVKPGSVVAVCAHRSLEMLAAIHGILLAGAAYAPIDPDYPEARRAKILEDLGEPPIVAAADCAVLFPQDRVLVPASGESELVNRADDPDALAYVIFTSGSTGRPKGVGIEHHSVLNRILWMQSAFPIGPGDVILQKTTVCFDVSVWELFWWSWTGAAVALAPHGAEKDPAALADAVERFGVTVMHFVPSMLAAFLTSIEDGRVSPARLRRLRYVFASGEALDVNLIERFNRLLHEPYGVELHNLYGPTEATVDVTWQPCSPWNGGEVVPIGKPIANTRILILNENGQTVPIGVPGEIYIGGPQVARGYINRPALTAERFVPDPTGSGDRLYRTGDSGRWRTDGTVEYLGRLDGQVKIRGFRIECGEVEHVLESHSSVEHAVVRPVTTGGLTELHAYVVGARAEAAALRAHLRSRLPDYMVPARFFRMQSLPLTSNGKLDRKRLSGEPLEAAADVDSATPIETELMALWHGVLGHSQFGPRDGFFDVGGNSLLLLRLHARLEERWPGLFTVAGLFSCSNIAAQASRIEQAGPIKHPKDQKSDSEPHPGAVAIVGMAVRLADFEDLDSFWRDLVNAADRVRPLPEKRESEARVLLAAMGSEGPEHFHEAAYLDDIYGFDPGRFRMAPADAVMVDPAQRIFYETAQCALEDAGDGGSALDGHKVGVFVGTGSSESYPLALKALLPDKREQVFALNAPSNAATRLSFLHDWSGPAMLVDTACSAALTALHQACLALQNGECEAALAGGAKVLSVPPADDIGFAIDSSTGRTRAFAAGSDGTGMGEGAAVFLLKPLERAQADGDTIHAVILGSAVNQDGASSGMTAPNPLAQAAVIRAAAESAGVELASLSYIEAHGTGTELGDPIEVEGLTRAFAGTGGDVALGSVKGNYGHLDSAAGALGLAKAVLCLQHGQVPPQPFFDAPNPLIDFAHAPVKVAQKLAPLVHRDCPLRAGVSSFGLSGINAHVILEEAPSARPSFANPADGLYVVALSAGSAEALRRYRQAMHDSIADQDISIADIAHTLATGRAHLRYRFAVAVPDRRECEHKFY
jgi:amino acid adenylation domain-containing protein